MTTFPVLTSTLSEKELGVFIKYNYNLNDSFECKLFRTGLNHTYFISDNKQTFVIRVYCRNWRTKAEIKEELNLLLLLKKNNISVSYPIADKEMNMIQEINAPEGLRYAVLFSFAKGKKMRFMSDNTCYEIGMLMAKFHNITANKSINRANYNAELLLKHSYCLLKSFFLEELEEM